jgi:hypothetical protein
VLLPTLLSLVIVPLQVAHDCAEAGANITVYGMNRGPGAAPFDYSKFYMDIMPLNGDDFNNRQLASQVSVSNTTILLVLKLLAVLLLRE